MSLIISETCGSLRRRRTGRWLSFTGQKLVRTCAGRFASFQFARTLKETKYGLAKFLIQSINHRSRKWVMRSRRKTSQSLGSPTGRCSKAAMPVTWLQERPSSKFNYRESRKRSSSSLSRSAEERTKALLLSFAVGFVRPLEQSTRREELMRFFRFGISFDLNFRIARDFRTFVRILARLSVTLWSSG